MTVSAYWITSAIARRSECSIRPFTGYDQPLNIQIERSNPDLSRSVYRSNAALVRNTAIPEKWSHGLVTLSEGNPATL